MPKVGMSGLKNCAIHAADCEWCLHCKVGEKTQQLSKKT